MNIKDVTDGLLIANAFIAALAQVASDISTQQAEGRGPTPDETLRAQQVTAQKRALAEAS